MPSLWSDSSSEGRLRLGPPEPLLPHLLHLLPPTPSTLFEEQLSPRQPWKPDPIILSRRHKDCAVAWGQCVLGVNPRPPLASTREPSQDWPQLEETSAGSSSGLNPAEEVSGMERLLSLSSHLSVILFWAVRHDWLPGAGAQ